MFAESEELGNETKAIANEVGDFAEKTANDFKDFTMEQAEMALMMAGVDLQNGGGQEEMGTGALDEEACAQLTSFEWTNGVCIEKKFVDRVIDETACGTIDGFEWNGEE